MAINLDHVTQQLTVTDTATNASLTVQPKGTGAFNIAAGSSGLNLSNGNTVTAITSTDPGSAYTSVPTVNITAPTTAGGVQAVITTNVAINAGTIGSGGTGYTVGNVLTLVGGTTTGGASTWTVAAVSGGVVTSVTSTSPARYTAFPSLPASVTGGSGSGFTFSALSGFVNQFVISNAGSGYVEQPTISFTGGGGSAAAAYATVGLGVAVLRGLTGNFAIYTPAGEHTRFVDNGQGNTYWTVYANPTLISPNGSAANIPAQFSSKGVSGINLYTNTGNQLQAVVTHTASAVNYVNITGAPTGSSPVISAQGSDSNIQIQLQAKGTGLVRFTTGGGLQAYVSDTVSAINYHQFTGSATGFGPVHTVAGSDTNIPLVLQPKGTGALQAQQTDSTATGGNARGANSVDWQTSRGVAAAVCSGTQSVLAGGFSNSVSGTNSFVGGGVSNSAAGSQAVVVGGNQNNAGNQWTFVGGGFANSAQGIYNFIGAGSTNAGTASAAVTTQSGTMNGTTAVTLSGSNANIKVGQLVLGTSISSYQTYVAAISGTSLTLSTAATGSSTSTLSFYTPHGIVVGGGNNIASGSYSFVGAGGDAGNTANRNTASGDWGAVAGGQKNTASGAYSFIGGGGGNTASSPGSVVCGGGTYGISPATFVSNVSSGLSAFVGAGLANTANSSYAAVLSGVYGTTRGIQCNHVFPASNNALGSFQQGSIQAALVLLGKQTTDATPSVLLIDTSAAGTTNQVIMPNNSAYFFTGEIVAGVTGGGNTKGWTIEGVIKRGANAASTALVGTPTVTSTYADAGASTWVIAVTADTTNGGLAVTFTGQASTTIRTVAQIRTTEMTY